MSAADSPFGPVNKWGTVAEQRDVFLWDLEVARAMEVVAPEPMHRLTEAEAFPERDASDVIWLLAALVASVAIVTTTVAVLWVVGGWWVPAAIWGALWVGSVAGAAWLVRRAS